LGAPKCGVPRKITSLIQRLQLRIVGAGDVALGLAAIASEPFLHDETAHAVGYEANLAVLVFLVVGGIAQPIVQPFGRARVVLAPIVGKVVEQIDAELRVDDVLDAAGVGVDLVDAAELEIQQDGSLDCIVVPRQDRKVRGRYVVEPPQDLGSARRGPVEP